MKEKIPRMNNRDIKKVLVRHRDRSNDGKGMRDRKKERMKDATERKREYERKSRRSQS